MDYAFDSIFPRYTQFEPSVPVYQLTQGLHGAFHRFFDTSPISPSGRYLGFTQMLDETRLPVPGDPALVSVLDLVTGRLVYQTRTFGWDTQLGAQVQWGTDDAHLYFNDMDCTDWREFGVCVNPLTGERRTLEGTIYMVSPDGKQAVSACLRRIGRTQAGYGVLVPDAYSPRSVGVPEDDGVFVTDLQTGRKEMLVSYAEVLRQTGALEEFEPFGPGDFYGFHVKYNPQGTRIMLVLRMASPNGKYIPSLFSMKRDGTDIRLMISPREWGAKGGHHPNWFPDGEHALMNLRTDGKTMRIVQVRYDGTGYGVMVPDVIGTGHPTLHPCDRFLVTDSYQDEPPAYGDGTTPIRVIFRSGQVENPIRICTRPLFEGPRRELRVDPHPAWDPTGRYLVFNAFLQGTRQLLLADMQSYL